MNTDNKISRRAFIKTSALTGGALPASTTTPGQAMNLLQEQKNGNKFAIARRVRHPPACTQQSGMADRFKLILHYI